MLRICREIGCFFDNVADPYQLNNLIGHPSFDSISNKLEELLSQELKRLEDEFLPGPVYLKEFEHVVDSTGTVAYEN